MKPRDLSASGRSPETVLLPAAGPPETLQTAPKTCGTSRRRTPRSLLQAQRLLARLFLHMGKEGRGLRELSAPLAEAHRPTPPTEVFFTVILRRDACEKPKLSSWKGQRVVDALAD